MGVRIVLRGGPVREKGGTVEIGRTGCDGKRPSKAQLCVGARLSVHTPLSAGPLPIKSQPHSVRLACEGQIRLPNHKSS